MANLRGQLQLIYADGGTWKALSSGVKLNEGAPISVVQTSEGDPRVFTVEGGRLFHTVVSNGSWKRMPSSVTTSAVASGWPM